MSQQFEIRFGNRFPALAGRGELGVRFSEAKNSALKFDAPDAKSPAANPSAFRRFIAYGVQDQIEFARLGVDALHWLTKGAVRTVSKATGARLSNYERAIDAGFNYADYLADKNWTMLSGGLSKNDYLNPQGYNRTLSHYALAAQIALPVLVGLGGALGALKYRELGKLGRWVGRQASAFVKENKTAGKWLVRKIDNAFEEFTPRTAFGRQLAFETGEGNTAILKQFARETENVSKTRELNLIFRKEVGPDSSWAENEATRRTERLAVREVDALAGSIGAPFSFWASREREWIRFVPSADGSHYQLFYKGNENLPIELTAVRKVLIGDKNYNLLLRLGVIFTDRSAVLTKENLARHLKARSKTALEDDPHSETLFKLIAEHANPDAASKVSETPLRDVRMRGPDGSARMTVRSKPDLKAESPNKNQPSKKWTAQMRSIADSEARRLSGKFSENALSESEVNASVKRIMELAKQSNRLVEESRIRVILCRKTIYNHRSLGINRRDKRGIPGGFAKPFRLQEIELWEAPHRMRGSVRE